MENPRNLISSVHFREKLNFMAFPLSGAALLHCLPKCVALLIFCTTRSQKPNKKIRLVGAAIFLIATRNMQVSVTLTECNGYIVTYPKNGYFLQNHADWYYFTLTLLTTSNFKKKMSLESTSRKFREFSHFRSFWTQ